jgi:hypothetical protein
LIPQSDIVSINKLTLKLKIIGQCDITRHAISLVLQLCLLDSLRY